MSEAAAAALDRMQRKGYRAWVLTLLMLISLFGFADRQIIAVLGQPIKQDLGITDAQLGLVNGLFFAAFNSLLAIPIARLADRSVRVRIIAVGVFLWSIATSLCGLARGFTQLAVARMLVGVGEATGSPATSSVLADYFPRERRTTAMSIFALAIPLGSLLGSAAGGLIAQHADWRTAFLVAGLPGVVLGILLVLTVKEPLRGHYDPPAPQGSVTPPLKEVFRRMIVRRAFLHTALGSTIVSTAGFGIITFNAPYFFRRFGLDLGQAGLMTGLITSLPGVLCMLAAGQLADRVGQREPRIYGWLPALASALAAPLYIAAFLPSGWVACAVLLTITGLVQYAYLPVSVGLYQNTMDPRMRASAVAVVNIMTNLVSASAGPFFVGALSDLYTRRAFHGDFATACVGARAAQSALQGACGQASAHGLQLACMTAAVLYLWGAVHFFLAAKTVKSDMA